MGGAVGVGVVVRVDCTGWERRHRWTASAAGVVEDVVRQFVWVRQPKMLAHEERKAGVLLQADADVVQAVPMPGPFVLRRVVGPAVVSSQHIVQQCGGRLMESLLLRRGGRQGLMGGGDSHNR